MKKKVTATAAVILAGGKNSRMSGQNKSFLMINGTSIITKTLKILQEIFEEIILVTNSPREYESCKDITITEDIIKNTGPLGGIHAAFSCTSKQSVFFTACDMPFLHNEMIERQISYFNKIGCDVLVPRITGLIEPLHAVYKRNLKEPLESFIKNSSNHSIKDFLRTVNTAYMDLEDNSYNRNVFININTPEDLLLWK